MRAFPWLIVLLAACQSARTAPQDQPPARPTEASFTTGGGSATTTGNTTGVEPSTPSGPSAPLTPFAVESVELNGATAVRVRFSHALDPATIGATKVLGAPFFSASVSDEGRALVLRTHDLVFGNHEVVLSGVRDTRGRALASPSTEIVRGGSVPGARNDFDTSATAGFTAVDDPAATTEGPSHWQTQDGALVQTSNVYGGSASNRDDLDKPGAYFLSTATFGDAFVEATLNNPDDDGMGLIARYQSTTQYYRFEWLSQGNVRRLVKINGTSRVVLDEDLAAFMPGTAYKLRLVAAGPRLSVFIDDELVLQARDTALMSGRFGVYCWGSQGLSVDDLAVVETRPYVHAEPPQAMHPGAAIFTHAPLITEVQTTSAMVWARTSEPADVRVMWSTSADLTGATWTAPQATTDDRDRSARVTLTGLQPDTTYWLRVEARDPSTSQRNWSEARSFKTAPLPDRDVDLSFVWFGDVLEGAAARFVAFDNMSAQQPRFALSLGDFPYADGNPAATTLAEYRKKHADVRSLPPLDGFLGRTPTYAVWDDHEVANDWDGATSPTRVQNGIRSWHEWWAVAPQAGAPTNMIYRSVRYGKTLELFLLDTRSQRPANSAAAGPSKSMLGLTQRAWLLAALQASTARFKVVVSSVPLRYGTTGNDHWQGFADERQMLFDAIAATGQANVLFITADQHWHAVHQHPEGLWEFQASSLSAGLREPLSPRPAQVTYVSKTHGYGHVEVTGTGPDPHVTVSLRDLDGAVLTQQTLR